MRRVSEIFEYMQKIAPLEYAMEDDNCGLLIGGAEKILSGILITLDVSSESIGEAEEYGCGLIISHHPLIFYPMKSILDSDSTQQKVIRLIKDDISLISMHTNLDAARGGVNDALADKLGLEKVRDFPNRDARYGIPSIGRIGEVKECDLSDFIGRSCEALGCEGAAYYNSGKPVHIVAASGGSCADYIRYAAAAGCDTFLTSDIRYKHYREACETGINLIDCGHFNTENVIIQPLRDRLASEFKDIQVIISKKHRNVMEFYRR